MFKTSKVPRFSSAIVYMLLHNTWMYGGGITFQPDGIDK